ncbi:putative ABC transport system permease protein [Sphingomonas sp. SORGH_AS802]|nr:ABC transporter permease [Sphingomonas sp. SORGH_AS_0802]MDR6128751.1 putative ABC transport system permease protein [Sphingomonas sp. SORGH_AS_0438]MDR6136235.1 putative ABC transport system permease protein [Sphingomonas sp. SORGH_AS_0802]
MALSTSVLSSSLSSTAISFYRSLTRHRLFATLNICGLALGIAAFLVLFLFVRFETQYGRWVPGSDRLWMVKAEVTMPGFDTFHNDSTSAHFLSFLQNDYPGTRGTRFTTSDASVRKGVGAVSEQVIQADPNFFRILSYPALAGDPSQALARPGSAIVTEATAKSYFGGVASAIGRTLTITIAGKTSDYEVAAVLRDLPPDTDFAPAIIVPIAPLGTTKDDAWSFGDNLVLLSFPDAAAAEAMETRLTDLVRRHPLNEPMPGAKIALGLQPLGALHLNNKSAVTEVATLGAIGLVTLLIALVNYINLMTAQAGLRAREVAMRKVLGATRGALIVQFLGESIAAAVLAGLLGLALTELALPLVNAAGGTSLSIHYGGTQSILPPFAVLVIGAGLIAGLYPALVLSRFQAAAVLASARSPGGGRMSARVRQALVVLQFAIAVALGTGTAVLFAQTYHVRNADLGFVQKGMMLVPALGDKALDPGQRERILKAFSNLPGSRAVSYATSTPAGGVSMIRSLKAKGGAAQQIMFSTVGDGFFKLMGARFIAGRDFDRRFAADDSTSNEPNKTIFRNVVMNESALRLLHLGSPDNAVGKILDDDAKSRTQLVGVVADMRFMGPKTKNDAMMYIWRPLPQDNAAAFLRFTGSPVAITAEMERVWHDLAPNVPFVAKTVEQARYDSFIRQDAQRMRLFTIGALLAVMIACIGLYGLASFDTARRFQEIGIRKTLGASTGDVLRLLIGRFLRPVLLATLLAWPIAYFAMRQWLSEFADRITLSPAFFTLSGVAAVAIATSTVFVQAWRVARAEPARALRYE